MVLFLKDVTDKVGELIIYESESGVSIVRNYYAVNHNYNKILKSDWFSTALISALIGQYASCPSNLASEKILEFLVF